MKEYYIYIEGRQEGPFLLNELKTKALSPDTLVWYTGAGKWMPAKDVTELIEVLHLPNISTRGREERLPDVNARENTPMANNKEKNRLIEKRKWWLVAFLLFIALISGAFLYQHHKTGEDLARKERIRLIREAEVQKALMERRIVRTQEQEAKKKEEARKALLIQRKGELQSLRYQYQNVKAEYVQALKDLDDIRRPHLFRSGARKEAEIAEQLHLIHSLENKARMLDNKINTCRQDIDQLSRN